MDIFGFFVQRGIKQNDGDVGAYPSSFVPSPPPSSGTGVRSTGKAAWVKEPILLRELSNSHDGT